jgi:hypothetical protein
MTTVLSAQKAKTALDTLTNSYIIPGSQIELQGTLYDFVENENGTISSAARMRVIDHAKLVERLKISLFPPSIETIKKQKSVQILGFQSGYREDAGISRYLVMSSMGRSLALESPGECNLYARGYGYFVKEQARQHFNFKITDDLIEKVYSPIEEIVRAHFF